ncbi:MAG: hypothetical protein VST67_02925, partial [Nitrospirota bacterium]|nr:hypothetical protein [Nitrospirota bacterium]
QAVVLFASVNHGTFSQRRTLTQPLSSKDFAQSAIQFHLHDLEKTHFFDQVGENAGSGWQASWAGLTH